MANRHAVVVSASLACMVALPACYAPVRHRVLTFFFDGVPEPGAPRAVGYGEAGAPEMDEPVARPGPKAAQVVVYAHPPYRDNRCGSCHNIQVGRLWRTPEEGLCQGCHRNVPGRAKYVHGPVVVKACVFCHHHHTADYPKVLRYDVVTTCFRCHRRADLTEGPHHETIDQRTCVTCHNPHGGGNRFFLKRDEP